MAFGRTALIAGAAALLATCVAAVATHGMGFSARSAPSALESRLATAARRWAIPSDARRAKNYLPISSVTMDEGLRHWADHCATCHGNDGAGRTTLGRSLHPPAPDMRSGRTQAMTDGELFYEIEHGIPFTGMPAWGVGTPDGAHSSWELVLFIRRLPELTSEDIARMETLNPKSPADTDRERDITDFLNGGAK